MGVAPSAILVVLALLLEVLARWPEEQRAAPEPPVLYLEGS